jgi:predicted transposase YbfD/YdcC
VAYFDITVEIEAVTGGAEILKDGILYIRWDAERGGSTVIRNYFATTDISRFYNSDKWAVLKSICMELQTTVRKSGETTYSFKYFLSSSDDMEEISMSIRLHWGVENGLFDNL